MRHLATILGVGIAIVIGGAYAACANPPTTAQDQKVIDDTQACLRAILAREMADAGADR